MKKNTSNYTGECGLNFNAKNLRMNLNKKYAIDLNGLNQNKRTLITESVNVSYSKKV